MSKVIRIPDSTFVRLQLLAAPFTDTPASVIDRLLDYWQQGHNSSELGESPSAAANSNPRKAKFLAMDPPDLHHTRLTSATVGDSPARNWNDLVAAAHREVRKSGCSSQELARITLSNVKVGSYSSNGFKPYKDLGLSIQNVDSNTAWRHALHLAKKFRLPMHVSFEWRNKEVAAYPGKEAKMTFDPSTE